MTAILDIQRACAQDATLPDDADLQRWADIVFTTQQVGEKEVTLRFVDEDESQELNAAYRGKDKPTNVLSFPFECPPGIPVNLLGDLVICAPVIRREAQEQQKTTQDHYAHMIVHGLLHLLGFDHIDESEAEEMEALEIDLLAKLGIDDPYQEH